MTLFGSTRSVITSYYALITPEGYVTSRLPGWQDATCVVLISPQIGAHFSQYMIGLGRAGVGQGNTGEREFVLYVERGHVIVNYHSSTDETERAQHLLFGGGYCYVPPGYSYMIRADTDDTRITLFERVYTPLAGTTPPAPLAGKEQEIEAFPFMGDEGAMLKTLLPDVPAFDMAVNLFTFQPGATLPIVEMHIMEHGLLMLEGQGIYRLNSDWHPVHAGDVIWMAPYCPQWFVATGKQPTRYLYYKDMNRDPLGP